MSSGSSISTVTPIAGKRGRGWDVDHVAIAAMRRRRPVTRNLKADDARVAPAARDARVVARLAVGDGAADDSASHDPAEDAGADPAISPAIFMR